MRKASVLAAMIVGFCGVAFASSVDDVQSVYAHYLGCLDGAASVRMEEGMILEQALSAAEQTCNHQADVLEGTLQRALQSGMTSADVELTKVPVATQATSLLAQARSNVKKMIELRIESAATLEAIEEAAQAATEAAEAAVPKD